MWQPPWTLVASWRESLQPTGLRMFFHPFFKKIVFLVVVGLNCYVKAFSSCSEQELLCCSAQASHCGGFSCYRAQASGTWASGVAACRLSSYGSRALEYKLSSCGAWAEVLQDMWNLPRPGIELMSPALAGFLTTGPPRKSNMFFFFFPIFYIYLLFFCHATCRILVPQPEMEPGPWQ